MLKYILVPLALLVLIFGGYHLYRYLKFHPPVSLLEFVLKISNAKAPPLPQGEAAPFQAPEGFAATIFARDIKDARVIVRDNKGTMLVSEPSEGKVVALPDKDGDHMADKVVDVLTG